MDPRLRIRRESFIVASEDLNASSRLLSPMLVGFREPPDARLNSELTLTSAHTMSGRYGTPPPPLERGRRMFIEFRQTLDNCEA
jgi:hypothetical protein